MQVFNRAEQVVNDSLDMEHLQVDVGLDDLLQIALCVLHHHVEGVEVRGVLWVEEFDEVDHEGVSELAHQGDLSQDAFAVCLVLEYVLHTLDCHLLASALLRGEDHLAVAARSE